MSKRVVDREKIREDLNSLIKKALTKIILSLVLCALATVFLVVAIIFVKSVLDPEAKIFWLIALAIIYCIILIAYPLYRFICGVYLVINLKIKIVFDKFSVTEDEIASRNAAEIKDETLGVELTIGTTLVHSKEWNINGEKVTISVEKV